MIDLTPEDIGEFRELYRRETGHAISDDEARAYALSILELVALVVRPNRPRDPGQLP